MKKLKIYLDTSIINFALAEDISLEDKEITKKLCDEINKDKFNGFISDVVLREIAKTKDFSVRDRLSKFVGGLRLKGILEVNSEIETLAEKYIKENIIPATYRDDALHIALSSVNGLDILASWNFKHLVRHKTRIEVIGVNTLLGYKNLDICTPWEVVEDV